jgi:alpha-glucosidase
MGIWWGCITGVWNWEYQEDPDKHGATTARTKRYIDACARNGIKHLLVEGWCEGWEGGIPGWRKMNLLKPYPDFDIGEVVRYGKKRGVSLVGHHETGGDIAHYESQLPKAFEYYKKWGINRIKTGYVTGDKEVYTGQLTPHGREHHHGQFMVRHHQKIIEMAAKYHIMIDAHEPIKATGISRTWPNFVAREGARGGEFNHFIGNPPSQTCTLPFTRFLGGPMDYTPGLFDVGYQPGKPFGTRAQQLALYVVFWSPVQMVADLYQAYDGEPAMQFIRNVPVGKWDETVVPQAEIGKYIVTARRQGRRWYVGAITNEDARTLELPLDFLEKDTRYEVVIYADGEGADFRSHPYPVEITEGLADQKTTLTLDLKPGGGVAIEMVPVGVAHTRPSGDAGLVVDGASYRLRAKHSGRLLGIKNGKVIQQVDMKRRKNQNPQSWKFKSIGEGHWQILCGGRALGALDKDNDSSIDLVSSNPKDPLQHWYLDHIVGSWYRIYLADTENVLDIQGVNYSDGGCAHLWQWVNKPNQIWSLEKK